MPPQLRVAVVGAGVGGLTAAHRLVKLGHEAVVYERWPGLGGMAATVDVGGGVLIERYYHHLFTSDHHIRALYEEIGLEDELQVWPSTVAMFAEGELHPFTSPLDLLRYRPMTLPARIRMGAAVVLLQRRASDVRPFEAITIREWVERRMGPQAWEKVWGPLLRGKFGHRADQISMSWLWAKLRARRQTTGDEARGEQLVYPRHTFEALFRRLEELIVAEGGRVLIDRPAGRVSRADDGGFLVHAGASGSFRRGHDPRQYEVHGEPERYDAVLATVPTGVFEHLLDPALLAEIDDAWLADAGSIEYHEALCLLIELDRQFHDYYWTNVVDEDLRFIGLIEQTNLVPAERYAGRRFLYVTNYLPAGHELLELSKEELLAVYEPGLRKVCPGFEHDWIKQTWLFREPAAQPIVLPNYPERMPSYETGIPGLLMANTTQVYPEDRGTNYAVREAERAVRVLLDSASVLDPIQA